MTNTKEKILIDLGADRRAFTIRWFLKEYPIKNWTEIHAFEAQGFDDNVPHEIPENVTYHHNYIRMKKSNKKIVKNEEVVVVKFIDFLVNTTKINPNKDVVIVKMDIEGVEWPILEELLKTDNLKLIDELFVEVHYHAPSMSKFGWDVFLHTREEALVLFQRLQKYGLYVYPWP